MIEIFSHNPAHFTLWSKLFLKKGFFHNKIFCCIFQIESLWFRLRFFIFYPSWRMHLNVNVEWITKLLQNLSHTTTDKLEFQTLFDPLFCDEWFDPFHFISLNSMNKIKIICQLNICKWNQEWCVLNFCQNN